MEITHESWGEELDSFSRQYEGWLVTLRIRDESGRVRTEAEDLPLAGISLAAPHSRAIAITVGDGSHLTHTVHDAVAMSIEVGNKGAARAILVRAGDGTTTSVEFRTPMPPEEVDGVARH